MKIKSLLKKERGSLTVIISIVTSALLVTLSASQNVATIMMGKEVRKSLAVKTAKRGGSGATNLVETLLNQRTIYYVANTDGTITWQPTDFSTSLYSYSTNAGTTNLPTIDMPGCNPYFYDGSTGVDIFRQSRVPMANNCAVQLSPRVAVTGVTGGGIWSRTGRNAVTVEVATDATIARSAAGPSLPLRDAAAIGVRPPVPQCTMRFAADRIIIGQTTSLTLATSRNTEFAEAQRVFNGALVRFPIQGGPPADLSLDQGGTFNVTPTSTGVFTYLGRVTGVTDPDTGVGGTSSCQATITVYPPPNCTVYADPGLITTEQSAVLRMQTNGNVTPILRATLDGTDVTAQAATTLRATKTVAPGRVGVFRYDASVLGVNNYVATCAASLVVEPPPRCTVSAPSPTQIVSGQTVQLSMSTNYPQSSINTAVLEGQRLAPNGGTITTAPPGVGNYVFTGYVLGPNGSSYTCRGPVPVTIFPPPYCGLTANPGVVEVSQPVAFALTTNNASSPISRAYIGPYQVSPNGGSVTLAAPGSPGTYTLNGSVYGINGSSNSCTSNPYRVVPRAACSLGASGTNVTLGDGVYLTLNTNNAQNSTITGSSLTSPNGNRVNFGAGGGQVFWVTNGAGGQPGFPAGVGTFHFSGSVTGNYGSTSNSCGVDVNVAPPPPPQCPYLNPNYVGVVNIGGGLYGFSRNTNYGPGYHGNCSVFYDPSYHNYPGPFANATIRGPLPPSQPYDVAAGCSTGGRLCYGYEYQRTCSTPVASVVVDLADGFCQAQAYHVRCVGCGCFDGEVKIRLADGRDRRASEVRNRDLLLNPATGAWARIKKITRGPEAIPMWEVGYGDLQVMVTEGHPFPTHRGMVQAKELTRRDSIVGADGAFHALNHLKRLAVRKGQVVYNFELDTPSTDDRDHQILANGIVTGDLFVQNRLSAKKTLP